MPLLGDEVRFGRSGGPWLFPCGRGLPTGQPSASTPSNPRRDKDDMKHASSLGMAASLVALGTAYRPENAEMTTGIGETTVASGDNPAGGGAVGRPSLSGEP